MEVQQPFDERVPIIPNLGVPLSEDPNIDSTAVFDVHQPNTRAEDIWDVPPSQFYAYDQDNTNIYGLDQDSSLSRYDPILVQRLANGLSGFDANSSEMSEIYHNQMGDGLAGIDMAPNSAGGRIDLGQFNKTFERNKEAQVERQQLLELERLSQLNQSTPQVSLYDLSILQILVNCKNAWFNILDDLLEQRFQLETFTKDYRLFYIGITILCFATILYIYYLLAEPTHDNSNVQKIYHIYPNIKYVDEK